MRCRFGLFFFFFFGYFVCGNRDCETVMYNNNETRRKELKELRDKTRKRRKRGRDKTGKLELTF